MPVKRKGKKRGGHMPHGFVSKAQMRLFFARPELRKYAHKEAHKAGMHSAITKKLGYSPAYKKLPRRKHAVKGRTYR